MASSSRGRKERRSGLERGGAIWAGGSASRGVIHHHRTLPPCICSHFTISFVHHFSALFLVDFIGLSHLKVRKQDMFCSFIHSFQTNKDTVEEIKLGVVSFTNVGWSNEPQGSPLSPLLYLFYNSFLVNALQTSSSTGVLYIDDILALIWHLVLNRLFILMQELLQHIVAWSNSHTTDIEPDKLSYTILSHCPFKPALLPPLLRRQEIPSPPALPSLEQS